MAIHQLTGYVTRKLKDVAATEFAEFVTQEFAARGFDMQVHGIIGEGSSALVFAVIMSDLGRKCAVRVSWSCEDRHAKVLNDMKGVDFAVQLEKPAPFDVAYGGDVLRISTMDYIFGQTLADAWPIISKSPQQMLWCAIRLQKAIMSMRSKGWFHGDLDRQNVMIEMDAVDGMWFMKGLKLIDFEGSSLSFDPVRIAYQPAQVTGLLLDGYYTIRPQMRDLNDKLRLNTDIVHNLRLMESQADEWGIATPTLRFSS